MWLSFVTGLELVERPARREVVDYYLVLSERFA